MSGLIKGKYRDHIYDTADGISKNILNRWKSNRIVQNSDILIASLMKGEANTAGILFLAFGTGLEEWDRDKPSPHASTQQLNNEIFRHPISPSELVYLNELGEISNVPTRRIRVSVSFSGSDHVEEGVLSLREFGLYGGSATFAENTGLLINYVIHPRIDLTPNTTLNRQLILTFDGSLTIEPLAIDFPPMSDPITEEPSVNEPTNDSLLEPVWLQQQPLLIIDGVGESYLERLNTIGISNIFELSQMQSSVLEIEIPLMKLVELKSKATLALQTIRNILLPDTLAEYTLRALIETSIERLVSDSGEPEISIQILIEQFGHLQMALDNRFLENKKLAEIIAGE